MASLEEAVRPGALIAAAGLAWGGSAAFADAPRLITLGAELSGTLSRSDARSETGAFFDEFMVTLSSGDTIEASLRSTAFDAALQVGRGLGTNFRLIEADDDSGGGTDARIRFTAPAAGVYTIRASALNANNLGAYALQVAAYQPPPPAEPKPLAIGIAVEGRLAPGGPRLSGSEERLYDLYTFSAERGERLALNLVSAEFDPFLELGVSEADGFLTLRANDDVSPEDQNARILWEAPEAGAYAVRAIAFDPGASGAYTLSLARLPEARPPARPRLLRAGQEVQDSFSLESPTFSDLRPFAFYRVNGRAGDRITLYMQSEALDSHLEVGADTPVGFAPAHTDDDGGGDRNARLQFEFVRTGSILVRASALQPGAVGAFTIGVE